MVGSHRVTRVNPYPLFDKEAYLKKIFWIVIGIIAFAVILFILIILKIWYDYRIYIDNENNKEQIKVEEIAERKKLMEIENALKSGETDAYTWSQNQEEVEIKLPIQIINASSLKSKHIECIFKTNSIIIRVLGEDYFKGTFFSEIIPSECSWQFELISSSDNSSSSSSNGSNNGEIITSATSVAKSITSIDDANTITEAQQSLPDIRVLEITLRKYDLTANAHDDTSSNNSNNHKNAAIKNRNQRIRKDELWKYITKEHHNHITTIHPISTAAATSNPSSSSIGKSLQQQKTTPAGLKGKNL